jgi:hypothetical protein
VYPEAVVTTERESLRDEVVDILYRRLGGALQEASATPRFGMTRGRGSCESRGLVLVATSRQRLVIAAECLHGGHFDEKR